jgi:hypothetical protein
VADKCSVGASKSNEHSIFNVNCRNNLISERESLYDNAELWSEMHWCLCPCRLYSLSSRRYLLTTAISAPQCGDTGRETKFHPKFAIWLMPSTISGYSGRNAPAPSTKKRTHSAIPSIVSLGLGWDGTKSLTRWDHASDRFANFSLRLPPNLPLLVVLVEKLHTNSSSLSKIFSTGHHNAHSVSILSQGLLEPGHSAR